MLYFKSLVGGSGCERSGGEPNTAVRGVENGVETLKESKAIYEIKALATGCTDITNDKINVIGSSSDGGIECTGPNLGVGSQFICNL